MEEQPSTIRPIDRAKLLRRGAAAAVAPVVASTSFAFRAVDELTIRVTRGGEAANLAAGQPG